MKTIIIIIITAALHVCALAQCSFYTPPAECKPVPVDLIQVTDSYGQYTDYSYYGQYGYLTFYYSKSYDLDRSDFSFAFNGQRDEKVEVWFYKTGNRIQLTMTSKDFVMSNRAFDMVCSDEHGEYYASPGGIFAFLSTESLAIIDLSMDQIIEYTKTKW